MDNKSRGDEYLVDKIDKAVAELVHPKHRLQKAYNYYNGKRDQEQFQYLEENFGIGNPTSVEFTPLIKKHVDALIGEFLGVPLLPKVSCKDEETISNISRDKMLQINKDVYSYLKSHLNNQILSLIQGQGSTDKEVETRINQLIEDINENFISEYEIAAQNVIEYIIQSRNTNLLDKLRALLLDLLVTGYAFYRVKQSMSKTNVEIEVLNPLNTFVDRNPESQYVKDSYRVVIRKWLTKSQILNKYSDQMDADSVNELEDMFEGYYDNSRVYVRQFGDGKREYMAHGETSGLNAGFGIEPGFPDELNDGYNSTLIPVYEVEWLDVDGKNHEMNRYEGVKIGQSIYILTGKSEHIVRSKDNPTLCSLSVNGLFFVNRSNEPYSLVLACAHLQDKYDLLIYMRDNILANSGVAGDIIDLPMLPTVLGKNLTERLQMWSAYKKQGTMLVDTSQEGRAFNNNTAFAGFDDTIKAQTIQAFELALERVESTTSSITGVFRERLNGIQQKDAVSNVAVGVQNSYTVTKHYYQQMDNLTVDILTDCLNIAKIVWKKGLTGTLVLGDKLQKVFTALPEYFTFTDYDVHITPSTRIMEEMKSVQQVVFEFIKSGQMAPDIIVEAMTARSMSELKTKVKKALAKVKVENDAVKNLQQQLEQSQQQLQQMQQQNQQLQQKVESLNEAKLQIDQQKVKNDYEIGMLKAKSERDYKLNTATNDTKRTEIEYAQLFDGDNMNNTVRRD